MDHTVSPRVLCRRKEEDGVFTFATAAKEDTPIPWMNPYTAIGPVGAAALESDDYYHARLMAISGSLSAVEELAVGTWVDHLCGAHCARRFSRLQSFSRRSPAWP